MATASGKARCITCGKEKSSYKCGGCSREFCFDHLTDHKQELSKQFDEIEVNRDLFRHTLTEQITNPQQHSVIQQIDDWERDSIKKIRKTADEARQLALKNSTVHIKELETKLNKLTDLLRQSRRENDFNEIDLRQFQEELTGLANALTRPTNFSIQHNSIPLINRISIDIISDANKSIAFSAHIRRVGEHARWMQNGITIAGGNGCGNKLNQLSSPLNIFVDDDLTVYIADWFNNRIMEWKSGATSGTVVAGGNGSGNRDDQLESPTCVIVDKKSDSLIISDEGNKRIVRWPRRNTTGGQTIISNIRSGGLAMGNDGYLYISDQDKHEVKRWREGDTSGEVVAGGNGEGDRLDQLNDPAQIFVDENHSVYVSDQENHRVMKWMKGAKGGMLIAGGLGRGSRQKQLSQPQGVVVDQSGTVYVADHENHRVMRWPKGALEGSIIVGGNKIGRQENQLHHPVGLSFDNQGNLYVADMNNHRVQKFHVQST